MDSKNYNYFPFEPQECLDRTQKTQERHWQDETRWDEMRCRAENPPHCHVVGRWEDMSLYISHYHMSFYSIWLLCWCHSTLLCTGNQAVDRTSPDCILKISLFTNRFKKHKIYTTYLKPLCFFLSCTNFYSEPRCSALWSNITICLLLHI